MVAGDVICQIVNMSGALIDAAVTALRVTANDKWAMCDISNGQQVAIIHIEEA